MIKLYDNQKLTLSNITATGQMWLLSILLNFTNLNFNGHTLAGRHQMSITTYNK